MAIRPSVPSSNELKRSAALRNWYAWALELEKQPAPVPVPVPPPALGAPLLLKNGVVYFNDGVTPAGQSGGVLVLSAPNESNPFWRQTTQAGSWDWTVAAGAAFTSGAWKLVPAIPAPPVGSADVPPLPAPPGAMLPVKRTTGSHTMAAESCGLDGNESAPECVRRHAALGWPWIWLHFDGPPWTSGNYADALDQFLAAALAWNTSNPGNTVYIAPGMHGNGATFKQADFQRMFTTYADHPATMRDANGRAVFFIWDYRDERAPEIVAAKAASGKAVAVFVQVMQYVVPEFTCRRYEALDGWLPLHPEVDGFVLFSVGATRDDGSFLPMSDPFAADMIMAQNKNIVAACKKHGCASVAGISFKYQGYHMKDADSLRLAQSLVGSGADYACVTSWNDRKLGSVGGDESAVGDFGTDFDGDKVWCPQRNAGYGTPYAFPRENALRSLIAPALAAYNKTP